MNLNRLKGILEEEILSTANREWVPLRSVYEAAERRHRELIGAPAWHSGIFNNVIANMVKAQLIELQCNGSQIRGLQGR